MSVRIHCADIEKSPRLQRLVSLLADGKEHSTLDIIVKANVAAVSAAVAELREHGITIRCRKEGNKHLYRIEDTILRVCCACGKIMGGIKQEGAIPPFNQTHGYCRKCFTVAIDQMNNPMGERNIA